MLSTLAHSAMSASMAPSPPASSTSRPARGVMILLEGMDMSGKSTAASLLSKHLRAHGVEVRTARNALVQDNALAAEADALRKQPNATLAATGALFLDAAKYDVAHFQPPPSDSVHVQDSSCLRVWAYHGPRGTRLADGELLTDKMDAAVRPRLPAFDAVFYLSASITCRQQRLRERQRTSPDECDEDDQLVFRDPAKFEASNKRLWEEMRKQFPHSVRIDTSQLSAEDVRDVLLMHLDAKLRPYGLHNMIPLQLSLPAASSSGEPATPEPFHPPRRARVMVIGVGPHARRIYLPELLAQGFDIVCAVDLHSQRSVIQAFLAERSWQQSVPMHYIEPFDVQLAELPVSLASELAAVVREQRVDGVVLATEPLVHTQYALWANKLALHVLMDKPVSTRINAACDMEQAQGIRLDFERILSSWQSAQTPERPTLFSVNTQRRWHSGVSQVLDLVRAVAVEHRQPVTYVSLFHSDGQLRLPQEMAKQSYHPYNQGYGKMSHSGYHFFDQLTQIMEASAWSRKRADTLEVSAAAVSPAGFIKQQTRADFERVFGAAAYGAVAHLTDEQLARTFADGFGEMDAQLQLVWKSSDVPVCIGSITLLHNGFARRHWVTPGADLYKGNGRVKHEQLVIVQGAFQTIHVTSYQSSDRHDDPQAAGVHRFAQGGHDHYDIAVYRNTALFADNTQPVLRVLGLGELEQAQLQRKQDQGQEKEREERKQKQHQADAQEKPVAGDGASSSSASGLKLHGEKSKAFVVSEFQSVCLGTVSPHQARSSLLSHRDSAFLMSAAYQSLVLRAKGAPSNLVTLVLDDARTYATPVQALALGMLDGGCTYVSGYPGFHSHDVAAELERLLALQSYQPRPSASADVGASQRPFMCLDEKAAFAQSFGASLAGRRAVVCMKNFGLNVASDAFLNSLLLGVRGGLVLLVTDDMDVRGSQGRQDSRHYQRVHGGLWLEPSSLEDAYALARQAFAASEELDMPVVLRVTNALFETRADRIKRLPSLVSTQQYACMQLPEKKFVAHPTSWRVQAAHLQLKQQKCAQWVEQFARGHPVDHGSEGPPLRADPRRVLLVSGVVSSFPGPLLVNGRGEVDTVIRHVRTLPLPVEWLRTNFASAREVVVREHGDPVVQELVQQLLHSNEATASATLGPSASSASVSSPSPSSAAAAAPAAAAFVPTLVSAWSVPTPNHSSGYITWRGLHRVFSALQTVSPSSVIGDLGQFTSESTGVLRACLCLGSAVAVCMGACEAGVSFPFCVSGDAALLHSGGVSLLLEMRARRLPMCVIVIDNGGSASTGGQFPAAKFDAHWRALQSAAHDSGEPHCMRLHDVRYATHSQADFCRMFGAMQMEAKPTVVRIRV